MHKLNAETAIVQRTFTTADTGDTVTIYIGKPFEHGELEWHCPYRIVGAGMDHNFAVIGIDSIQALQCAFVVINSIIYDKNLLWLDGPFVGFLDDGLSKLLD